jgi:hypothetical protein
MQLEGLDAAWDSILLFRVRRMRCDSIGKLRHSRNSVGKESNRQLGGRQFEEFVVNPAKSH